MLIIFQICFFAGLGLIGLSLVFGQIFEAVEIEGLDFIFPFSPVLWMLFSTIFGGVGWILVKMDAIFPMVVVIFWAVLVGFLVTYLLQKYFIGPLKKAQNTSAPEQNDLIGLQAVVTETIVESGFGEIQYIINGNSFAAPARSTTEEKISKGANVVICWIEDYVFYVSNIAM